MPIFEYTCRECGKVFEKLILRKGQVPSICPHCGSNRVEQKFSAFSASTSSGKSSSLCAPAGGG